MSLASLSSLIEDCEKEKGETEKLKAVKANIAELQRDVDSLKSTDVTMLWGDIEIDEPRADTTPRAPPV
ncbi:MAG: hypothetical protein Q8811_02605 [Candidatus Phytoplasma australasiaticum]|nr:hypothetical protein [Candidatus Phytoplasma australasiaticum]